MSNYYPEYESPVRPRGLRARLAAWFHREQEAGRTAENLSDEVARDDTRFQSQEPPIPP